MPRSRGRRRKLSACRVQRGQQIAEVWVRRHQPPPSSFGPPRPSPTQPRRCAPRRALARTRDRRRRRPSPLLVAYASRTGEPPLQCTPSLWHEPLRRQVRPTARGSRTTARSRSSGPSRPGGRSRRASPRARRGRPTAGGTRRGAGRSGGACWPARRRPRRPRATGSAGRSAPWIPPAWTNFTPARVPRASQRSEGQ